MRCHHLRNIEEDILSCAVQRDLSAYDTDNQRFAKRIIVFHTKCTTFYQILL